MHPDTYIKEITYTLHPDVPARYLSGGRYIFTAYGCALTLRRTARGFVYEAVNLQNGKSETLRRATTELDETACIKLADKIRLSSVRGLGRCEVDRKPGEHISHAKLTKILNHIFSEVLPECGYVYRENQLELSAHILEAISRRCISFAESEVGTGKTLAYLAAAALARRGRINDSWLRGNLSGQNYADGAHMPAVIATSSIALQRAIEADYIPELSRILMEHDIIRTPLTCAVRKGKEHYICEMRLRSFHSDADAATKTALDSVLDGSASCDLADAKLLTQYMKQRICVKGRCKQDCQRRSRCRYMKHLEAAADPKIDFQITNHNYFLADVLRRVDGKKPLFPHYQLVIIDEAHKFLSAARQMYGLELSDLEIPELDKNARRITDRKSKDGVNVHILAKKLAETSKRLFDCLRENSVHTGEYDESGCYPAIMNEETSRLMKLIHGIADDLAAALGSAHTRERFSESKAQIIWELKSIMGRAAEFRKYEYLICWLECPQYDGECETFIRAIPKELSKRLYADVWSMDIPFILTSATLSVSGDFQRIRQSLGIDRVSAHRLREKSLPSPFDFENNALLYLSEAVPFPEQKDKMYISAVADEIGRIVRASCGHAAVLFTSYSVMGKVYAITEERDLPFPLFRMGRRDTAALERFKQSDGGVLFASGALWEGIDIPGDALSMLIIVKLPFAAPDPIGDYERSLAGSTEAYIQGALVPDMLVKLKQGFGRLIRTENDTGVCAVLDSRANGKGAYHRMTIAALPPCNVTGSVSGIESFIRKVKTPDYFEQRAA